MLVERHKLEAFGFIVTIDVVGESAPDGKYLTTDVHKLCKHASTGELHTTALVLWPERIAALEYDALELTRESEPWSR